MTPNDNITFLSLVGSQFQIFVLGTGAVGKLHVQGQGNTVAETGCQVEAHHVVCFLNLLTLTLPGQGVRTQLGAVAFQKVAHIHTEDQYAAV